MSPRPRAEISREATRPERTPAAATDSAAMANVAVEILANESVYKSLSEAAAHPSRKRTWAEAAAEIEAFVATLPA